ncbi:MAG: 2,3,4,5-tetrahydropyridine-2,6-dicarboxylate N-succinyltransferase [Bdellovibrionales bacterium]
MIIGTRAPETLRPLIEQASEISADWPSHRPFPPDMVHAIEEAVGLIDRGKVRVASPTETGWEIHSWLKQAILLYFRIHLVDEIHVEPYQWVDKIPIKRWTIDMGVRVVPPATVRYGAYVGKGAVLMPSYVNIGAYVDEGTMIDTWATVGSCAQVGKNVHVSGGVGLGGVLEPLQAQPVIVEDNCFIGSRAIIVEGVRIGKGAVIGAGVVLTKSTPIVDVRTTETAAQRGYVPPNCVVIPGSIPKQFPGGEAHVPCALIIGDRTPSTDLKTSLNQALRDFDVPV